MLCCGLLDDQSTKVCITIYFHQFYQIVLLPWDWTNGEIGSSIFWAEGVRIVWWLLLISGLSLVAFKSQRKTFTPPPLNISQLYSMFVQVDQLSCRDVDMGCLRLGVSSHGHNLGRRDMRMYS